MPPRGIHSQIIGAVESGALKIVRQDGLDYGDVSSRAARHLSAIAVARNHPAGRVEDHAVRRTGIRIDDRRRIARDVIPNDVAWCGDLLIRRPKISK
jgi:hypothetical protein